MKILTWTPALAKRFWDDLADTDFLAGIAFSRFAAPYLVELCRQYLTDQSVVLDFGGGFNSYLAQELLKKGAFVKIYEPSLHEAQLTNEFLQNPRFLGIDSTVVPSGYDLIFAVEVIEHLFDEDIPRVLEKMRTGLKPGGVLVMTTPNQEDLLLSSRYCPVCQQLFHPWGHLRSFNRDSLRKLVESSGLTCEAMFDVDFSNARMPIEELKALKRTLIAQADHAEAMVSSFELSERIRLVIESVVAWKKLGTEDLTDTKIGAGGTLVVFASTRAASSNITRNEKPLTTIEASDNSQRELEATQRILQLTQAERDIIQQTLQAAQAKLEANKQTLETVEAQLQTMRQTLEAQQAEHKSTQVKLARYENSVPIQVLRKLRGLLKNRK